MTSLYRHYTPLDELILRLDRRLRAMAVPASTRENPAGALPAESMTESERGVSAGLMRVNHAGEVCAQALYLGQAVTAGTDSLRGHLLDAAAEEGDHLAWCEQRLQELHDHTSYLNPLWFAGSFAIGAAAGLAGDRWSLGFIAETERQVEQHLEGHERRLPASDRRSRAIIEQMKLDEARHGRRAMEAGGQELPVPVRKAMRLVSRIMTGTAYWV
jgi:3-demethoxyubiquinol 3-hydroxylase